MIFTSLMSLWEASYKSFSVVPWRVQVVGYLCKITRRLVSYAKANKVFQRIVAYVRLLSGALLISLLGIGCSGGDDTSVLSKPDKVTGLEAKGGDEKVDLLWDKMQNATSYMVYMDDEEPRPTSGEGNNGKMNFTVDNLNNGQMYSFRVAGVNAQGEGEKSNVVQGIPKPVSLQDVVVSGQFGDATVTLTWKKVEHATYYRIYKLGPEDTEFNISTQGDIPGEPKKTINMLTYTDAPLMNEKYYFYQVQPIMEITGEEPVLGGRTSFTGRPRGGPAAKRPQVSGMVDNANDVACSIMLDIEAPEVGDLANPTGYRVEIKDVGADSDAQPPIFVSVGNPSTSHTISSLDYGKAYKVIVTASKSTTSVTGVTEGEEFQNETNQLMCERMPWSKPAAPTVITVNTQLLRVSWERDPRATHYKILLYDADGMARGGGVLEKPISDLLDEGSCCVYEDTGLSEGTLYGYAIQAVVKDNGETLIESQQPSETISTTIRQSLGLPVSIDLPHALIKPFADHVFTSGRNRKSIYKLSPVPGYTYEITGQLSMPLNSMRNACDISKASADCSAHDGNRTCDSSVHTCIPKVEFEIANDNNIVVKDINSIFLTIGGVFYTNILVGDTIEMTVTLPGGEAIVQNIELVPPPTPAACDAMPDSTVNERREKAICMYARQEIIPAGYPKQLVDTTQPSVSTPADPALDIQNLPNNFLRYDKSEYQLIFNDEFSGSEISPYWGFHRHPIGKSPSRSTAEKDVPCGLWIENGHLNWKTEKLPDSDGGGWCLAEHSTTQGIFEFLYGYVEYQFTVRLRSLRTWSNNDEYYTTKHREFILATYSDGRFFYLERRGRSNGDDIANEIVDTHPLLQYFRTGNTEDSLRMFGAEIDFTEIYVPTINLFLHEHNVWSRTTGGIFSGLKRLRIRPRGQKWPLGYCMYEKKRGVFSVGNPPTFPKLGSRLCAGYKDKVTTSTYQNLGSAVEYPDDELPADDDAIEYTFRVGIEWKPDGYVLGENDVLSTTDTNSLSIKSYLGHCSAELDDRHISHSVQWLIATSHWMQEKFGTLYPGRPEAYRSIVEEGEPAGETDLEKQEWRLDYMRVYQPRNRYHGIDPIYNNTIPAPDRSHPTCQ